MEELENRNILSKTFFWMFLGLLGTGLVAFYTYSSGLYLSIFTSVSSLAILALVEVVVVIVFSLCFRKLPPTVVGILYFVYAFLNGRWMFGYDLLSGQGPGDDTVIRGFLFFLYIFLFLHLIYSQQH